MTAIAGQMSVWNSCLGDVRCYLEFLVSSVLQVCRDNGIDPLHDYTNRCLYTVYPTHRPRHPLDGTRARTLLSLPARDNAGPEGHFKSVGLSTRTCLPFLWPYWWGGEGGNLNVKLIIRPSSYGTTWVCVYAFRVQSFDPQYVYEYSKVWGSKV